jgi:hypothetical protein
VASARTREASGLTMSVAGPRLDTARSSALTVAAANCTKAIDSSYDGYVS